MRRRVPTGRAVALLAVAALAPAGAAFGAGSSSKTVHAKDIAFSPKAAKIKRGGRVTWRFEDRYATHNVTSTGAKRFKSSRDQRDGTYAVTFRKAGTYRYECTLHPGMTGRVVVGR